MGVFIYDTEGELAQEDFTIKAIDILLMAKGHAAEVGYVADQEMVMDLMALGYEEKSRGLIHSHHSMGTSFSGTDTEQLKLSASSGPYYLSVVSNNKLEITAKIAIKSTLELEGFSFFRNLQNVMVRSPKSLKQESFDIYQLEVILEKPEYMKQIDDRIERKIQNYTNHVGGNVGGQNNYNGKGKQTQYNHHNNYPHTQNNKNKRLGDVNLFNKPIGEGYDYGDFIKAVLDKYCKAKNGNWLSPEDCSMNIFQDEDSTGIPVEEFILYLTKFKYISVKKDQDIINELEKFVVKVN